MVTTEISQLSAECNAWRQTMRNYRNEITQLKHQLQEIAATITSKELLQDVEHYHNQFHIQLINIHDIKHAIKAHDMKASAEMAKGQVSDDTLAKHEHLHDEFHSMEHTLDELKLDFSEFLKRVP